MITPKLIKVTNGDICVRSLTTASKKLLYAILSDKENCYYQPDLPLSSEQAAENMARLSETTWNKYGLMPENSEFMLITTIDIEGEKQALNVVWIAFNRDISEITVKWVANKLYKDSNIMLSSIKLLIDYCVRKYKTIKIVKGICDNRNSSNKRILDGLNFSIEGKDGKNVVFVRKYHVLG